MTRSIDNAFINAYRNDAETDDTAAAQPPRSAYRPRRVTLKQGFLASVLGGQDWYVDGSGSPESEPPVAAPRPVGEPAASPPTIGNSARPATAPPPPAPNIAESRPSQASAALRFPTINVPRTQQAAPTRPAPTQAAPAAAPPAPAGSTLPRSEPASTWYQETPLVAAMPAVQVDLFPLPIPIPIQASQIVGDTGSWLAQEATLVEPAREQPSSPPLRQQASQEARFPAGLAASRALEAAAPTTFVRSPQTKPPSQRPLKPSADQRPAVTEAPEISRQNVTPEASGAQDLVPEISRRDMTPAAAVPQYVAPQHHQGVTEPGPTEQGVTEQGVTEQGVTEQGVTEQGVTEQGVVNRDDAPPPHAAQQDHDEPDSALTVTRFDAADALPRAPFLAEWEVDRFHWPEVCEKLKSNQREALQEAGEQLMGAAGEGLSALVVTSACRGEGRTTLAMCLARAAAEAGSRVALVDADLDHPSLAEQLNVRLEQDWRESVFDGGRLEDSAILSIDDRLTLVPLMSKYQKIGQSLADRRVAAMLQQLTSEFDLVVIDAGPLSLAEKLLASTASASIDAVIVVRDQRSTTEEEVDRCVHALREVGVEAVGIAENFGPSRVG